MKIIGVSMDLGVPRPLRGAESMARYVFGVLDTENRMLMITGRGSRPGSADFAEIGPYAGRVPTVLTDCGRIVHIPVVALKELGFTVGAPDVVPAPAPLPPPKPTPAERAEIARRNPKVVVPPVSLKDLQESKA